MTFSRNTHYIAAFLRRKWDVCQKWDGVGLLRWVQWYVDHDRCLVVKEKNRIQCVALYRCVNNPKEINSPFANSDGRVAYIEVAASRSTQAMKAAFDLFLTKVAAFATHIAWIRGKYKNRFTIQPLCLAARHLTLNYHG